MKAILGYVLGLPSGKIIVFCGLNCTVVTDSEIALFNVIFVSYLFRYSFMQC